jgi:hypothetical protein
MGESQGMLLKPVGSFWNGKAVTGIRSKRIKRTRIMVDTPFLDGMVGGGELACDADHTMPAFSAELFFRTVFSDRFTDSAHRRCLESVPYDSQGG